MFRIVSGADWGDRTMSGQWMPVMGTKIAIRFDALNEQWAQNNHGQSLARLAERGGLGADEALAILKRRRWTPPIPGSDALRALLDHLRKMS